MVRAGGAAIVCMRYRDPLRSEPKRSSPISLPKGNDPFPLDIKNGESIHNIAIVNVVHRAAETGQ